jgi:fructokinase
VNNRTCIFGEVLFDHFPDGKRVLGGAPFNVAWHLQAFGQAPYFISRVGDDPDGEAVYAAMRDWGMDTEGLQADRTYPTGRVTVQFEEGEPVYEIAEPSAYDVIESAPANAGSFGLLYHGTLALRSRISRQTAEKLKIETRGTVFIDVNLRPPWWERENVLNMVRQAHWVKLNVDELNLLQPASASVAARAATFLSEHRLDGLVLTRGSEGAEIFTANGDHFTARSEAPLEVVDTVGAGDAFASVMILGLTVGWQPAVSLQRAQAFASALVGQRGATVSDPGFYHPFIDDWNL